MPHHCRRSRRWRAEETPMTAGVAGARRLFPFLICLHETRNTVMPPALDGAEVLFAKPPMLPIYRHASSAAAIDKGHRWPIASQASAVARQQCSFSAGRRDCHFLMMHAISSRRRFKRSLCRADAGHYYTRRIPLRRQDTTAPSARKRSTKYAHRLCAGSLCQFITGIRAPRNLIGRSSLPRHSIFAPCG